MRRGEKKRKTLARRQKGICHYCHRDTPKEDRTIEHLIPISRGGKQWKKNLRMACRACNYEKGNLTEEEYRHALAGRLMGGISWDGQDRKFVFTKPEKA